MSAIDRGFVLALVARAHDTQEHEAQLATDHGARTETLKAETRSYTLALLADAIEAGLLEQLADAGQQALFADVAAVYNTSWQAYLDGKAGMPDPAPLSIGDEFPVGGVL
jgi:hypothetical protein